MAKKEDSSPLDQAIDALEGVLEKRMQAELDDPHRPPGIRRRILRSPVGRILVRA